MDRVRVCVGLTGDMLSQTKVRRRSTDLSDSQGNVGVLFPISGSLSKRPLPRPHRSRVRWLMSWRISSPRISSQADRSANVLATFRMWAWVRAMSDELIIRNHAIEHAHQLLMICWTEAKDTTDKIESQRNVMTAFAAIRLLQTLGEVGDVRRAGRGSPARRDRSGGSRGRCGDR